MISEAVFVLQIEKAILQNEDMFQMTIIRSVKGNNCFSGDYLRKRYNFLLSGLSIFCMQHSKAVM